jgi:hypothetical protein
MLGSIMDGFVFDDLSFQGLLFHILLPFLVTLFFLQGFRTFVVDIYIALFNILWEGTGEYLPLLGLLVFATPLFVVVLNKKLSSRYMLAGSAILSALFTLPLSLGLPYEMELLMASMVVAFYSIFLPFYLNQQIQPHEQTDLSAKAGLLSISIILAFSYDLLFRTVGTTYDISRLFLTIPIQLLFALTIIGTTFWNLKSPLSTTKIDDTEGTPATSRIMRVFAIAGMGAFLFLQHSLLLNPHNLLRWSYPTYFLLDFTIALILTLLVLVVVAIVLLHNSLRNYLHRTPWYALALGNLVLILLLSFLLVTGGWLVMVGVIGCQLLMFINLYFLLRFTLHPTFRSSIAMLCAAIFLTLLIFLLWDFFFAFTFVHAYLGDLGSIFAGQAITIILSAAVILGITSTYALSALRRLTP